MNVTITKHLIVCTAFTLLLVFILIEVITNALDRRPSLVVQTKFGKVQGVLADDGEYTMFLRVPYAVVDKDNPFGLSIPNPEFKETFQAHDDDSAMCPQFEEYNKSIFGTLDCLYLNIFVPHSVKNHRFPVMVFIHGGRFERGFANRYMYGPKFFMKQDIIFVIINYRVGPYGFLCLDTPEVPGNQGLKDQMYGMEWVRQNIYAFGGDPDRITLCGSSSGGASVEIHLLHGPENLLFNKVILQSGIYSKSSIYRGANRTVPFLLAEDLGFATRNLNEALSFLAKQNTSDVIRSSVKLHLEYGVCVEKEFAGVQRFITTDKSLVDPSNVKKVSMLIQQSNIEMMVASAKINMNDSIHQNIFKDNLRMMFNDSEPGLEESAEYVKHFYIGDNNVSTSVGPHVIEFLSDFKFYYLTKCDMKKFLRIGVKKLYSAMFSYSGGRNYVKRLFNLTAPGACHGDELGYLFDISYMNEPMSDKDKIIMERMTTLWANFVKYSDPTPETSELLPVKWLPYTTDSTNYLDIDSELSLKSNLFHNRMAFWELFYKIHKIKLV